MILNISKGSNEREQVVFPPSSEGDMWVTHGKQNSPQPPDPGMSPLPGSPQAPKSGIMPTKYLNLLQPCFQEQGATYEGKRKTGAKKEEQTSRLVG